MRLPTTRVLANAESFIFHRSSHALTVPGTIASAMQSCQIRVALQEDAV